MSQAVLFIRFEINQKGQPLILNYMEGCPYLFETISDVLNTKTLFCVGHHAFAIVGHNHLPAVSRLLIKSDSYLGSLGMFKGIVYEF